MRQLTITQDRFTTDGPFTISRGSRNHIEVMKVTLRENNAVGHGECVPYARYNETIADAMAELEAAREQIEAGLTRDAIAGLIKSRSARNALDCALWDLEAKRVGKPVWQLAGLPQPKNLTTAYTLSLDSPESMAQAAYAARDKSLLKIKLGAPDGDDHRLRAIRTAVPDNRLIIDANEGWTPDNLAHMLAVCTETGIELVEQPLPAQNDDALRDIPRQTLICADESAHDSASLDNLIGKYDAVNIKLDKTGGLTEALTMVKAARDLDFQIMIGCMLATSLAMAPAMLAASHALIVDLDGPLLLAEDRTPAIGYDGSIMHPADPALWG